MERASVLNQPDGVGSERSHVIPLEDFDGVPIAFMARPGVVLMVWIGFTSPIEVNVKELQNKNTKKKID